MPSDKECSSRCQDGREDKVVLWLDPFMDDVHDGMKKYKEKILSLVEKKGCKKIQITDNGKGKKRTQKVWYLDTKKFNCISNHYSLRVRQLLENGKAADKVEFSVKYRHPDPEVVNGVNLKSSKKDDCKYEQDVVPEFEIKFSRSNTLEELSENDIPKNMGELRALFPHAFKEIKHVADDKKLKRACDFHAKEVAYKEAMTIDFGPGLEDVEAGFNFWYQDKKLVVAEFSFAYDLEKQGIPRKTARRAYAFFLAMQCPGMWVVRDKAATKTQFAYGDLNKKDASNC